MAWTIYTRDGGVRSVEWLSGESVGGGAVAPDGGTTTPVSEWVQPELEYHGEWMGETFVTLTIKCAVPIPFEVGDYIMYRGEKFVMNYDPTVVKRARRGTFGEGFTYENVKFNSLGMELTDVRMLDYVIGDNGIHYSSLPRFSYFCADLDDHADRLQANTNRWCADNGMAEGEWWVFVTASWDRTSARCASDAQRATALLEWRRWFDGGNSVEAKENQNVSVDNQSVWDSLREFKDTFDANFTVRGRAVVIGAVGRLTQSIFAYGKGNGLYEIERTADSEQQIVTKLFAYGTDRNLPTRYYANINLGAYATVTGVNASVIATDIEWSESALFGKTTSTGYHSVTIEHDGTSYPVVVRNGNGYLCVDVNLSGSVPSVSVNDTISFTSGVDVDKWPVSKRVGTSALPDNMAVSVLMLPGFPTMSLYEWVKADIIADGREGEEYDDETGYAKWRGYEAYFSMEPLKPYVLSVNHATLGIRESTKFFDGSDGTDEICPSIEGTGYDTIYKADVMADNGVFADGTEIGNFHIWLPYLGDDFDLDSLLTEETAISMRDGYCGGRDFKVVSAEVETIGGTRYWKCECERVEDSSLQLWFPYSYNASMGLSPAADEPYQVRGSNIDGYDGDTYVLTGIEMTSTYVEFAAEKLLVAALETLAGNDYTRYTYTPRVDELFMARQHESAESDDDSMYLTIKEGDVMRFEDADLGIDGNVFIDTLGIKEYGNGHIPTYDVTLRDDKQVGTIERIQERIDSISVGSIVSGSGFSSQQFRALLQEYGSTYFLSRNYNDTAKGIITFLKGIKFGSQQLWSISGDGDAILRNINAQKAIFDKLTAKEAHFFTLIIDEIKSVGGQLIITPANCRIDKVTSVSGGYKCYFKKNDSTHEISNQWRVGMQAIHQEFNIAEGGSRNYWRIVKAIGEEQNVIIDDDNTFDCHYIVLGSLEGEYKQTTIDGTEYGTSTPRAGDDLSQLGFNEQWYKTHISNTLPSDVNELENAIVISAYNIPFIDTESYLGDARGIVAPLYVSYSGINSFSVTSENRIAVIAGNGNLFKGRVVIEDGSTLADGRDINNLGVQEGNLLRNSGFTGDYESIDVSADLDVSADTETYSDPLKYWDASSVEVQAEENAVSGYSATINNILQQTIESGIKTNTWYMLSFKAYVANYVSAPLDIILGGVSSGQTITNSVQRFALPLKTGDSATNVLSLSANGVTIYDLMLVQGNIDTEYKPSEKDNDKAIAELLGFEYLQKAIKEASTEILGGLIMTALIKVGNYVNGQQVNTGGMSGLYADDNSPFLWGGGTFEQAIHTIMQYYNHEYWQPETDEDWNSIAKFVVTHGGRIIANDIILRGYIYATGGVFNGTVYATDGEFNGTVHATGGDFNSVNHGKKIVIDATNGDIRIISKSSYTDDDWSMPNEGAGDTTIFSVSTQINPDSLTPECSVDVQSLFGSVNIDSQFGVTVTGNPFSDEPSPTTQISQNGFYQGFQDSYGDVTVSTSIWSGVMEMEYPAHVAYDTSTQQDVNVPLKRMRLDSSSIKFTSGSIVTEISANSIIFNGYEIPFTTLQAMVEQYINEQNQISI